MIDLSRLQSQLQTSGLQQKDNPLFQVISQLIASLKQIQDDILGKVKSTPSSGGGTTNIITSGIGTPGADGIDGNDGVGIPGATGPQGPAGPASSAVGMIGPPGQDGLDGGDSIIMIGSASSGGGGTTGGIPYSITAPVDGDYAWINQGGASVSVGTLGIYLLAPAVGSVNLRIRKKAAPATPYSITVAIAPFILGVIQVCGICFRNSGSGKLAINGLFFISGTSYGLISATYSSPTAFNATYISNPLLWGNLLFLRITDDGANRICSYSTDGTNFIAYHTVVRTDYFTADEVGFFVDTESATYDAGMTLLSWKET